MDCLTSDGRRRVVITGMGVVAPNGIGIESFWDSLVHGRSGIRKVTYFDASSYPCQVAAEVPDFNPTDYMDTKTSKKLAKFAQFALTASKMAVEDSEIDLDSMDPYRIGVIIGTGIGGGDYIESQCLIFLEKGIRRLNPHGAMIICAHSAVGVICRELGLKGPNTTVSSACTSGLDAVYLAYNTIKLGDADIMLTGAGEAPITPCNFSLFCAAGVVSKENEDPQGAIKPFDINSSGIVLGEGGAVIILESLQNALKRKAKIYAEILGCASGNESYDIFEKDPSGNTGAIVMRKALENACLKPQDIDYINAHGNGQPEFDLSETFAVKKTFGELAYQIPISSIKPITGQSFAVTGILQMITSVLVINNNIIPPTINHTNPRPNCDLNYVPNHFRNVKVNVALMNAMGLSGSNTVAVIGRFNNSNP